MKGSAPLMPTESAGQKILLMRGQRVMLDADLAELYGVATKALNQAVRRNAERFPADFMFQLTSTEKQEVVTICDHLAKLKFSKNLPHAFTEHGALMLGNVLKSTRATQVSLLIVRAFVQLREMLAMHKELAARLEALGYAHILTRTHAGALRKVDLFAGPQGQAGNGTMEQ